MPQVLPFDRALRHLAAYPLVPRPRSVSIQMTAATRRPRSRSHRGLGSSRTSSIFARPERRHMGVSTSPASTGALVPGLSTCLVASHPGVRAFQPLIVNGPLITLLGSHVDPIRDRDPMHAPRHVRLAALHVGQFLSSAATLPYSYPKLFGAR